MEQLNTEVNAQKDFTESARRKGAGYDYMFKTWVSYRCSTTRENAVCLWLDKDELTTPLLGLPELQEDIQ